ncbi:diguanylate cyclase domain-containing protein [Streptomyces sp. NPDC053427]|uniref:diguanylate cyclase domain-containing protein n=1 Tax=Streptomyces sp. NPDC053427 TaxID=3365701 RepID=UPI0037D7D114
MGSNAHVPALTANRALLITSVAVSLTGWTLHAVSLHRRLTADRLARWVGPHGIVGRLGGDEFAVAKRMEARTAYDAMSQRLRLLMGALHEPVPTEAGLLPVAASVGAAASGHLGTRTLPALLRGADVSMYRTKHSGRYGWAESEDLQVPTVNGRREGRRGTAPQERAA